MSQKSILCDVCMCIITLNDTDLIIYANQITNQWWASLGVRDGERCWFTEEIDTYMRCRESPGDRNVCVFSIVSLRSTREKT